METHTITPTAKAVRRLLHGPIAVLAVMIAAGAPLMAQDAGWSKYNYGLQLGALLPQGELKDGASTGFGLAGYMEKVWSNSWALRGRLEYTQFGEKEYSYYSYDFHDNTYKVQLKQTGVMLDLIYYMSHKDTIYPFAGIGYFNRTQSETLDYQDNWGGGRSEGSFELDSEVAFCLGAGWNFTPHLGVEVKYTVAEFNWIQLSVLYRF